MDIPTLIDIATRADITKQTQFDELPNLSIYSQTAVSELEASVYEPVMCLVLQGAKTTSIGDQFVDLRAGDALLVSHDLPVISRITQASKEQPYVALLLSLDLAVVRSLQGQIPTGSLPEASTRALATWRADPTWLTPLLRYCALAEAPTDADVLGPSILRETYYRLMLSPIGGMLRRLLRADSNASRIANAIHMLRSEFRAPLSVADLAQRAGMSTSSFHQHFKAVTGTTPLQFQKDLRLIEARVLLRDFGQSVSEVAYAVGYESPTHFSRAYSKKFGEPPSRDRKVYRETVQTTA